MVTVFLHMNLALERPSLATLAAVDSALGGADELAALDSELDGLVFPTSSPAQNESDVLQYFLVPSPMLIVCSEMHSSGRPMRTASLAAAMLACLERSRCVSVMRHHRGMTRFCHTQGRKGGNEAAVPENWESAVLGGCRLVHGSAMLAQMHHESGTGIEDCRQLGLQGFRMFTVTKKVPASFAGCTFDSVSTHTDTVYSAAIHCLDRGQDCGGFAREQGGGTWLCIARRAPRGVDEPMPWLMANWTLGCRRCGVRSAEGLRRHTVLPALREGGSAGARFLRAPGRAGCSDAQLLGNFATSSELQAELICAAEPRCTTFSRRARTAETWFCQGYHALEKSPMDDAFVTGMRRGCELYSARWRAAKEATQGLLPGCGLPRPSGGAASAASGCPVGLPALPLPSRAVRPLPPRRLCDECPPLGLCPLAKTRQQRELAPAAFAAALRSQAAEHLGASAVATNPSIFRHEGRLMVVYRMTEARRCSGRSVDGAFDLDGGQVWGSEYRSSIGMCEVDSKTLQPESSSCVVLADVSAADILHFPERTMEIDPDDFVGFEDPRGFSFGGNIHIIANQGILIKRDGDDMQARHPERIRLRRLFMLVVTANGTLLSAHYLSIPHARSSYVDDKNVIPLVGSDGQPCLVYSFFPHRLCKLDLASGLCSDVDLGGASGGRAAAQGKAGPVEDVALSGGGTSSGSTQAVPTAAGYLTMMHRKQDLEFGGLYTHKWVLLDNHFPHTPVWVSGSFRLPLAVGVRVEDIQFAAGLVVDEALRTALVSYGVSDCISWVASLELPPQAAAEPGSLPPLRPAPTVPWEPTQPQARPLALRWESAVVDLSGFATVTRALGVRLMQDAHVQLRLLERGDDAPPHQEAVYGELYKLIARSQADLAELGPPDVTVRLHWEPNFQPVPMGKLVQYLPWEFEALPAQWVTALNEHADEVWVPAQHTREGFVRSGVAADKVHVVPHGVPEAACRRKRQDPASPASASAAADEAPLALSKHAGKLKLLYHGGLLWRKGIDLLLDAYSQAFGAQDRVVLLLHSTYGDAPVYELVRRHLREVAAGRGAEVEFLEQRLSEENTSRLYEAADVLVHPARSEGFGLTVAEAMAHGLPVILPAYGAAAELLGPDGGLLVPAEPVECTRYPCAPDARSAFTPDWATGEGHALTWANYASGDLAAALRRAYERPEELAKLGAAARRRVCSAYSWELAYKALRARLDAVTAAA